MKSLSTRRTRASATKPPTFGEIAKQLMRLSALSPLLFQTVAHAQSAVCPSFLLRPDVVAIVEDTIERLSKSTRSMSAEASAKVITADLKRKMNRLFPNELMQLVKSQVNAIERPTLEKCFPQAEAYLKQVDIARGLTDEVRIEAAESERLRQAQKLEEATARERDRSERQTATLERLDRLRAENEANRSASEARAREREERQRAEATNREREAEDVKRDQASAIRVQRLFASYRSMLIVKSCFDSLKGAPNAFATQAQLNEAQSLIKAIEGKVLAADTRLNKEAIFASAKQEEDRLAGDPAQANAPTRGGIIRRAYDDTGKAFCDAQLFSLRNTAAAAETAL